MGKWVMGKWFLSEQHDFVKRVVGDINFSGYKLNVFVFDVGADKDYTGIQVEYTEPDVMTGVPETQKGRIWIIEPTWGATQIVQTCFKALLTSLEHRARARMGFDKAKEVIGNTDPYEVLGVLKSNTWDEIKSAYRKLIMLHHPDRNPGDSEAVVKFKLVQAAYEVLEHRLAS